MHVTTDLHNILLKNNQNSLHHLRKKPANKLHEVCFAILPVPSKENQKKNKVLPLAVKEKKTFSLTTKWTSYRYIQLEHQKTKYKKDTGT